MLRYINYLCININFIEMVQSIETEKEVWVNIKQNPVYLVSNYGRVKTIDHPVWCKVNNSYSIRKGRICKLTNKNSKKYWRVGIQINNKQKQFAVHRLVAESFIPNPKKYKQINHIDGDKNNNKVSNLEWCDQSHNMRHALEHGLISRKKQSENAALRKLSVEQVKYIRSEYLNVNTTIRGEKMRFCRNMMLKFGLKSPNTIFWIITNGTNKFI